MTAPGDNERKQMYTWHNFWHCHSKAEFLSIWHLRERLMLTYSSEKERSVLICKFCVRDWLWWVYVTLMPLGSSSAKQHWTSVFILVLKSSGWKVTLAAMPGVSLMKAGGKLWPQTHSWQWLPLVMKLEVFNFSFPLIPIACKVCGSSDTGPPRPHPTSQESILTMRWR